MEIQIGNNQKLMQRMELRLLNNKWREGNEEQNNAKCIEGFEFLLQFYLNAC
jgi:hypothetical protein